MRITNNILTSVMDTDINDEGTFIIPENVTCIGSCAFECCKSLTSITIPKTVTGIGSRVFRNCKSLKTVTIPNSVTRLRPFTFRGCSSLETVIIPDSIKYISEFAFDDCPNLSEEFKKEISERFGYVFDDNSEYLRDRYKIITSDLSNNNYELSYYLESVNVDKSVDKRGSAISELCHEIKTVDPSIKYFINIDSFRVREDVRNQGVGYNMLKSFCDFHDDKIIFILSGARGDEYVDEPSNEEIRNVLEKLNKFYTRVGFVNVNQHIGQYQYAEAFIYKNKAGEELLKHILKNQEEK